MKHALIIAALALAGCATVPAGSSAAKSASPEEVAGCKYVDDFVGTSNLYGMFATQGIKNARAEAAANAAKAGATHVVWAGMGSRFSGSTVQAKGYRCGA